MKNKKNSNNMESLTLQADGPITWRAYIRGAFHRNIFSAYMLMAGLITGGLISRGGLAYNRDFTVSACFRKVYAVLNKGILEDQTSLKGRLKVENSH